MVDPTEHPHRRCNALTGEYILVSPHRTSRPWLGQVEKRPPDQRPVYDPACYLCPGNERAGGIRNPHYDHTFVFDNDFAALLPESSPPESSPPESSPPTPPMTNPHPHPHPLLQSRRVTGTCRVVCFSPRHDLTLPEMALTDIRRVVDVWAEQTTQLGKKYRWVQVFENKGAMMGASNPHPHGQIWAMDQLPNEPHKEEGQQAAYFAEHGRPLLLDYVNLELEKQERLVVADEYWVAVVPYWAIWPFEILLLPRRHILRLPDLSDAERDALAGILKRLLTKYDNLFETFFPYSMGWHGAPFVENDQPFWQLHAHFYPPLLRSATVKKFMVGFEMLGEAQRDLTAEQAATRLRELPETHYRPRPALSG